MKKYLLLYYLSSFITLVFVLVNVLVLSPKLYLLNGAKMDFIVNSNILKILLIISAILLVLFTVLIIKKRNINSNNIFPISYIIFFVIVLLLTFIFNNKVIVKNIHFEYYESIILINYLLLNVYSLLSIDYKNLTNSK